MGQIRSFYWESELEKAETGVGAAETENLRAPQEHQKARKTCKPECARIGHGLQRQGERKAHRGSRQQAAGQQGHGLQSYLLRIQVLFVGLHHAQGQHKDASLCALQLGNLRQKQLNSSPLTQPHERGSNPFAPTKEHSTCFRKVRVLTSREGENRNQWPSVPEVQTRSEFSGTSLPIAVEVSPQQVNQETYGMSPSTSLISTTWVRCTVTWLPEWPGFLLVTGSF